MDEEEEEGPKAGDKVSMDVEWPTGHIVNMIGKLVCIRDGEAFIETSQGLVVGTEESLEKEESERPDQEGTSSTPGGVRTPDLPAD